MVSPSQPNTKSSVNTLYNSVNKAMVTSNSSVEEKNSTTTVLSSTTHITTSLSAEVVMPIKDVKHSTVDTSAPQLSYIYV